ncbi:hypothetical protein DX130_09070 [Paenibacillus paeoniae]|uniref:Uncharacterized protein n=1 Tax=Paenibacillus paeoniae TaxID=2292705 RepID=A0A371PLS1_9BACL|nr:hypothetical protein DX130_09070 [Paenibacillus paeoniae]
MTIVFNCIFVILLIYLLITLNKSKSKFLNKLKISLVLFIFSVLYGIVMQLFLVDIATFFIDREITNYSFWIELMESPEALLKIIAVINLFSIWRAKHGEK